MMVFVPLAFGLSPDLVFPLNVENDESVGPAAGTWVVAIFERRFCGVLLVDGADKLDELVSGLVGAARSAEECGPGSRWPGPHSHSTYQPGHQAYQAHSVHLFQELSTFVGLTLWRKYFSQVF